MKTSLTFLLLLSAGVASAQFDSTRRDDRRDERTALEGRYTSVQRNNTVYRTLRLGRDGSAEIVTEFRGKNPGLDRRNGGVDLSDRDVDRYGKTAERAAKGRVVRHRGRWTLESRRLVLRMNDVVNEVKWRESVDLPLDREGGSLVLNRNTDLYGNERIGFQRDGGWGGGRPGGWDDGRPGGRTDYGYLQYDRERLKIVGIDLADDRDSQGRLIVRTEGRRIELRGDVRRRGDDVTLRTADGEYIMRMRNGVVESIRGSGTVDRRRIAFTQD